MARLLPDPPEVDTMRRRPQLFARAPGAPGAMMGQNGRPAERIDTTRFQRLRAGLARINPIRGGPTPGPVTAPPPSPAATVEPPELAPSGAPTPLREGAVDRPAVGAQDAASMSADELEEMMKKRAGLSMLPGGGSPTPMY